MISVIAGPNEYAAGQELNAQITRFVTKNGVDALEKLDAGEAELNKILSSIQGLSLLSNKKLVVLKYAASNKDFNEKAQDILADVPETTDVILYEPAIDKRTSYYKFLKTLPGFKEFSELSEQQLVDWIVKYTKDHEGKITPNDARHLIQKTGPNQYLLSNEIKKLISFKPNITREQIDLAVPSSPKSTIFDLLDSAFGGDKTKAMKIYGQQRSLRVEPQQIMAMLAWQLHVLAVIVSSKNKNDALISKEAKLNPFVVQKSRRLAAKITMGKLKNLIAKLAKLDEELKTSSIDADDALKAYLLSMTD